jgi:hypothetical protein
MKGQAMIQEDKGPAIESSEVDIIITVGEGGMDKIQGDRSHSGDPNPPNKSVDFRVRADNACGTLCYYLEDMGGNSVPNQRIKFPNGPEWYNVTFHLVDNDPTRQIEFDSSQPICAHEGSTCPASGSGIETDQIQDPQLDPSQKRLTIVNRNQDPPRQIGYILCFFDGKTGRPLPPFDPIMDNQGGGHTLASF